MDAHTVRRARRELEQAGEIPPTPQRRHRPKPPPRSPARDAIAQLGLDATPRQVASLAGISVQAAWRMLATVRAEATARCLHCGRPFAPTPRKGGRDQVYCSRGCADAVTAERLRAGRAQLAQARQPRRKQYARKSAPPPDFSRAWCARCPPDKRDLWSSEKPADREAARNMCLSVCPVLDACRAYAVTVRVTDYAVYGGMTWAERAALHRARRATGSAHLASTG